MPLSKNAFLIQSFEAAAVSASSRKAPARIPAPANNREAIIATDSIFRTTKK